MAAVASARMTSAVPAWAVSMVGAERGSVGDTLVCGHIYAAVYRNVLPLGAADVSYCDRADEILWVSRGIVDANHHAAFRATLAAPVMSQAADIVPVLAPQPQRR